MLHDEIYYEALFVFPKVGTAFYEGVIASARLSAIATSTIC